MVNQMDFKDKNTLVIGMAKSGVSSALLLKKLGAHVAIYDAKSEGQLKEALAPLAGLELEKFLGEEPGEAWIAGLDLAVISPGVPLDIPLVKLIHKHHVKLIAEIELGFLTSKAQFVTISGTNGKTTTTALTGEMFQNAGYHTYVLGNIGVPITSVSLETKEGDIVVAETAALQLDTIDTYHPKAALLLNITEDHLNRYKTMENYINAKARMFENQNEDDYCILNYDNQATRELAPRMKGKLLWISLTQEVENGAYVDGQNIIIKIDGKREILMDKREIRIPGEHNVENALGAILLAHVMGIANQVIVDTLKTFPGVEHRIEFVREVNGIRYINDSKGTNPDATIKAIAAMDRPTVLILGGSEKNSDFLPMFEAFTENIRGIVVLGETKDSILAAARKAGFAEYKVAKDLKEAVDMSTAMASEGYNVLLSPACASFDMFENFEHRGEVFKEIVNSLR